MVSESFEEEEHCKKIWNDLPQKPVARTVPNFCKRLQVCMDKAGGH